MTCSGSYLLPSSNHFHREVPALFGIVLTSLSIVRAGSTPIEVRENSAKGLRLLGLAKGAEPVWKTENESWSSFVHMSTLWDFSLVVSTHVWPAQFFQFDVTEVYDVNEPVPEALMAPAVTCKIFYNVSTLFPINLNTGSKSFAPVRRETDPGKYLDPKHARLSWQSHLFQKQMVQVVNRRRCQRVDSQDRWRCMSIN